jgi:hypothetical protein
LDSAFVVIRLHEQGGQAMSQRTVIHLTPIFDGWAVKFDGTKSVISAHTSRTEAEKAAKELAESLLPSVVVIHKDDGQVEAELEFGEETV